MIERGIREGEEGGLGGGGRGGDERKAYESLFVSQNATWSWRAVRFDIAATYLPPLSTDNLLGDMVRESKGCCGRWSYNQGVVVARLRSSFEARIWVEKHVKATRPDAPYILVDLRLHLLKFHDTVSFPITMRIGRVKALTQDYSDRLNQDNCCKK